jgi:hypothetical protein
MSETKAKDFDINQLLHPARAFLSPADVVKDPDLTLTEKRAILASWASDACAVSPELRRPPGGPVVTFDDVMDALRTLDGEQVDRPGYAKLFTRAQRVRDLCREGRPTIQ